MDRQLAHKYTHLSHILWSAQRITTNSHWIEPFRMWINGLVGINSILAELCAFNWFYELFALFCKCLNWVVSVLRTLPLTLCLLRFSVYLALSSALAAFYFFVSQPGLFSNSMSTTLTARTNSIRLSSERQTIQLDKTNRRNCLLVWPSLCASQSIYAHHQYLFCHIVLMVLHLADVICCMDPRRPSVFAQPSRCNSISPLLRHFNIKGSFIVTMEMAHNFVLFLRLRIHSESFDTRQNYGQCLCFNGITTYSRLYAS